MKPLTVSLLLDTFDILLLELEVHGNGGRLDSNTTFLFILSSVRKPHVSGLGTGDNTSLGDKGIGEGGFSVIDCEDMG